MFGIFTKACTPSLVFRLELSLLLEAITFIWQAHSRPWT
jgi:hypothetical protein